MRAPKPAIASAVVPVPVAGRVPTTAGVAVAATVGSAGAAWHGRDGDLGDDLGDRDLRNRGLGYRGLGHGRLGLVDLRAPVEPRRTVVSGSSISSGTVVVVVGSVASIVGTVVGLVGSVVGIVGSVVGSSARRAIVGPSWGSSAPSSAIVGSVVGIVGSVVGPSIVGSVVVLANEQPVRQDRLVTLARVRTWSCRQSS